MTGDGRRRRSDIGRDCLDSVSCGCSHSASDRSRCGTSRRSAILRGPTRDPASIAVSQSCRLVPLALWRPHLPAIATRTVKASNPLVTTQPPCRTPATPLDWGSNDPPTGVMGRTRSIMLGPSLLGLQLSHLLRAIRGGHEGLRPRSPPLLWFAVFLRPAIDRWRCPQARSWPSWILDGSMTVWAALALPLRAHRCCPSRARVLPLRAHRCCPCGHLDGQHLRYMVEQVGL
jgi:hypothetical protein